MKTIKQLKTIFDKSKGDNEYITFDSFLRAGKEFQQIMKKDKGRTICHMEVSPSGMTRKFNFDGNLNLLFNVCYNQKRDFTPVKVSGCGMDMHWYLKFTVCKYIFTEKELEKWNINSLCSNGVNI